MSIKTIFFAYFCKINVFLLAVFSICDGNGNVANEIMVITLYHLTFQLNPSVIEKGASAMVFMSGLSGL